MDGKRQTIEFPSPNETTPDSAAPFLETPLENSNLGTETSGLHPNSSDISQEQLGAVVNDTAIASNTDESESQLASGQETALAATEPNAQFPTGAVSSPIAGEDERYNNKYAKKHRADLDTLPDGAEKNYLLDRIFPQMAYFSERSQSYKKTYHALTILCLIFNGIVPFIMLFEQVECIASYIKFVVAALSSAAGILTAVLALKKHRELWVQYRICLEQLKRAVSMYFLGAGEFSGMEKEPEKRKQTLFAVCENITVNEHNQWTALTQRGETNKETKT